MRQPSCSRRKTQVARISSSDSSQNGGTLKRTLSSCATCPGFPSYVRRNPLDRQGPLGVLRARPVESWRDLVPTVFTPPAQDAEERDVGGARKEGLEGLRPPSK